MTKIEGVLLDAFNVGYSVEYLLYLTETKNKSTGNAFHITVSYFNLFVF